MEENLLLATSQESVDQLNARFYGRFPYPWRPAYVDYSMDADFATIMLNQNIGDWHCQTVPSNARIWIAGCGTNQAAITAVNFPHATVVGSDISRPSLESCRQVAADLGLRNLELREESLNEVRYTEEFDYVISTGVIHHNADPAPVLRNITRALKPTGILELMVYNRFHRILTSAFQKAIRELARAGDGVDFDREFSLVRPLIDELATEEGLMGRSVKAFKGDRNVSDAFLADTLMQPVEHSYTVETLEELCESCNLEYVAPMLNTFDKSRGTFRWNLAFRDERLREMYTRLPDSRRWQITNLLLAERSPMVWFYLKRKDAPFRRRSEREICESFLETSFRRTTGMRKFCAYDERGALRSMPPQSYPTPPSDPIVRQIVDATREELTFGEVLKSLRMRPTAEQLNDLRLQLTTSAFPYLTTTAINMATPFVVEL